MGFWPLEDCFRPERGKGQARNSFAYALRLICGILAHWLGGRNEFAIAME